MIAAGDHLDALAEHLEPLAAPLPCPPVDRSDAAIVRRVHARVSAGLPPQSPARWRRVRRGAAVVLGSLAFLLGVLLGVLR